jgi:hypothetical protein
MENIVKKKGADGKVLPENNWVWSPSTINQKDKDELPVFQLPYSEKQNNIFG